MRSIAVAVSGIGIIATLTAGFAFAQSGERSIRRGPSVSSFRSPPAGATTSSPGPQPKS